MFTPLAKTKTQPYERQQTVGLIETVFPKTINIHAKCYKFDQHYAYDGKGIGHTMKEWINLKHKFHDLIDQTSSCFKKHHHHQPTLQLFKTLSLFFVTNLVT